MITMIFLNWLYDNVSQLILSFFGNAVPTLNSISLWLTTVSIPQIVLDMFSITLYFIPLATVSWLFTGTLVIWAVKFTTAAFRFFNPLNKLLGK